MREINTIEGAEAWLRQTQIEPVALRSIDLRALGDALLSINHYEGSILLGCDLDSQAIAHISANGGLVISDSGDYAFPIHRSRLYHRDELYGDVEVDDPNAFHRSWDYRVYQEFNQQNQQYRDTNLPIKLSLHRRLHDQSISDSVRDLVQGRKVIAIMGGHSMKRADPFYTEVATLSRMLTQKGFLMISGGGPGAMEATHLGAYFASRDESDLLDAIAIIQVRTSDSIIDEDKEYLDKKWLNKAYEVIQKYPEGSSDFISVGIPTWRYGFEPAAPFASHIAKYFANSVREDGLLEFANHGVVFAPGSAGTTQEIFQDACQNHYETFGLASPMILMGIDHWTQKRPIWQALKTVASEARYGELLALTDDRDEIIRRLLMFNPDLYSKS